MKGYKLFRLKNNKLYPLYVTADKEMPIGVWIDAECGEITANGKVKSKLGELAYRPGLHINGEIPYVTHIGIKDSTGKIAYMKPDHVWCEFEYSDEINYQDEANECGLNKKGKIIPKNAYIKHIPVNGYYRYKTNPNMTGEWIIAGSMKILKIMDDNEVFDICKANGVTPLPRYNKVS